MLDLDSDAKAPQKPPAALPTVDAPPPAWQNLLAAGLIGAVGLALLVVFFLDRAAAERLRRADQQYLTRLAELQRDPSAETLKQVSALDAASQALLVADQRPPAWSALLKDFQATTSPGISLGGLSVDEKGTVKIDGSATSWEVLGRYLATLRGSEKLTDVFLVTSSAGAEAATIQFSIAARLIARVS